MVASALRAEGQNNTGGVNQRQPPPV